MNRKWLCFPLSLLLLAGCMAQPEEESGPQESTQSETENSLLDLYRENGYEEQVDALTLDNIESVRLYKDEDYSWTITDPDLIEPILEGFLQVRCTGVYRGIEESCDSLEAVTFHLTDGSELPYVTDAGRLRLNEKRYNLENKSSLASAVSRAANTMLDNYLNEEG